MDEDVPPPGAAGDIPEGTSSTNVTSDQIDSETASKLRGDAIGDTMYSESFVLKTLLQFNDLNYTEDFDNDLTFLWSMIEEKAVCEYLVQLSYPQLACSAIMKYDEPRFIEVVVGIFADLLVANCIKDLTPLQIKILLTVLDSTHTQCLFQINRAIYALSFMYDKYEFVDDIVLARLGFILANSTHAELIRETLKTVAALTEETKLNEALVKGELFGEALIGYQSLENDDDFESHFESKTCDGATKYLIKIACNLCSYINDLNVVRLVDEVKPHLGTFVAEIGEILKHFAVEENLLPVSEELIYYIEGLSYIYRIFPMEYSSAIMIPLLEILSITSRVKIDSYIVFVELWCYLLYLADINVFKDDLCGLRPDKIEKLLSDIQQGSFAFDFNYIEKLRVLLNAISAEA